MKIGRYEIAGHTFYGEPQGDLIYPLTGELAALVRKDDATPVPREAARLLAPLAPGKIVAIGPGQRSILPEGATPPERPFLFMKPGSTVADPGQPIVFPADLDNIQYELEIAIVIGRTASRVSRERALDYVLGYTCCNDVTAGVVERDLRTPLSYHWKAYDTFGPLGPVIATDLQEVDGLAMEFRLNGEVRHQERCSLIYAVDDLVSWISQIMTLYPGDVIATGAAAKGDLKPGDHCELEIEGIGRLGNPVIAADRD